MRYLITQSLLNSWQYIWSNFDKYGDNRDEYSEKAYDSFISSLKKEEFLRNESMHNGILFEELVTEIAKGGTKEDILCVEPEPFIQKRGATNWEKWFDAATEVANDVKGGQFQLKAYKDMKVAGHDFFLYGKLDCLKAGVIYDIKFSSSYEVGKFFNSPQHSMYMELVPEATKFVYIVSNGKSIWRETYLRSECRPIQDTIAEFTNYLINTGLFNVYQQYWESKPTVDKSA